MSFPKEIADFMAKYGVTANELWEVRRGGAYAIKHKALERIARNEGMKFEHPIVLFSESKSVAMLVTGTLGTVEEWATGEASPENNKNSYPWAMAEKRGKDRVILKLLESHGDIYSEDEAEDFKRPNPHVTTPGDVETLTPAQKATLPATPRSPQDTRMKMKSKDGDDARADYKELGQEMMAITVAQDLRGWWLANLEQIETFPGKWPDHFRQRYEEHLYDLMEQEKAA